MTQVFGGRRYKIIKLDEQALMPWRNGGGSMRDLLLSPQSAGAAWDADWTFRISVANIDRSGPFSAFPGIERWFALLSGDGLVLEFDDRETRIAPGDPPLRFDGGLAPNCRLLGGPAQALNLMVKSGSTGSIDPLQTDQPWRVGGAGEFGVFSRIAGHIENTTQECIEIPADSLVWFDWADHASVYDGELRFVSSITAPWQASLKAAVPLESAPLWRVRCG